MKVTVYIAASVDGFISTADGGVEWLEGFSAGDEDYGYHAFLDSVDAVVMGRVTYDQVRGFGDWPYAGKRSYVLSSRALDDDIPPDVERWAGSPTGLMRHLEGSDAEGVWMMGGGRCVASFLDIGAVDEIDLCVMPVLLGQGLPLFVPRSRVELSLELLEHHAYNSGVVRLRYAVANA